MPYLIKLGSTTAGWTENEALVTLACENLNRFYGPGVATAEHSAHRPGKVFWRAPGELKCEMDARVVTVSYQREHCEIKREVTLAATLVASTGVVICMDNTLVTHTYAAGPEEKLADLWREHRALMASTVVTDWHLDDRW